MVGHGRGARRPDDGLTLVELMVTMVVGSLVATSTFMFFGGQQRIYDTQTRMLNVQQSVWAAMETVARHARASRTGMTGCVRPDPDMPPGTTADPGDPPPVDNDLNVLAGTPPSIDPATIHLGPQTGLRANIQGTPAPEGDIRIPPLWIANNTNVVGGIPTDVVLVAYGEAGSGNWFDTELGLDKDVDDEDEKKVMTPTAALTAPFKINEFIIILDKEGAPPARPAPLTFDRGCSLFQISDIPPASNELTAETTGVHDRWNVGNDPSNLIPFLYTAAVGAPPATGPAGIRNIGQIRWVAFFIQLGPNNAPSLFMQRLDLPSTPGGTTGFSPAELLAEGIEDLQVAYACDSAPNNGVFTEGTNMALKNADEWFLNTTDPGENPQAVPPGLNDWRCNRPEAVRITLIARSLTADNSLTSVTTNRKPAVEDGVLGPVDQFRHRSITTTVFLRND